MKALIGALLFVATTAAADVRVSDNDKTLAVDCAKDPNVDLDGNKLVVTLAGTCERLTVNGNNIQVTGSAKAVAVAGNENKVMLVAVDLLGVAGNDNRVRYKKPVSAKKVTVGNAGSRNKITKVK